MEGLDAARLLPASAGEDWQDGASGAVSVSSMSDAQGGNGLRHTYSSLSGKGPLLQEPSFSASSGREGCVRHGLRSCIPKACTAGNEALRPGRRGELSLEQLQHNIPSTNTICSPPAGRSIRLQPAAPLPKPSPSTRPRVTEMPYLFPAGRDAAEFQSPGAGDPVRASPARLCWEVLREDVGLPFAGKSPAEQAL